MLNKQRIVFVGPMGAGKTTIGKQIASHLGCDFYDSDRVIEERTGVSIPLIFELEGEEGFRRRETEVLTELCNNQNIVLATGGGAVLREENRKILQANSLVIFLNASLEQLFERTCRDRNRPLLQTKNPKQKLKKLLEERLAIYEQMSHIIVKTDNQSIHHTVNNILEKIDAYETGSENQNNT
ncbi:MAG: shikimate kinase AroK [Pseudomonadota bacterium]